MIPPLPPLTDEQKQAVARYRDTLSDIVFMAATRYQYELEKQGIPSEHIAGPLLAGLYGAAEKYMRLSGAEEFAKHWGTSDPEIQAQDRILRAELSAPPGGR